MSERKGFKLFQHLDSKDLDNLRKSATHPAQWLVK